MLECPDQVVDVFHCRQVRTVRRSNGAGNGHQQFVALPMRRDSPAAGTTAERPSAGCARSGAILLRLLLEAVPAAHPTEAVHVQVGCSSYSPSLE